MGRQVRGFGFLHDGSVDTHGPLPQRHRVQHQHRRRRQQLEQFILAFDSNMAPIVGQQTTLTNANSGVAGDHHRLDLLDARAAPERVRRRREGHDRRPAARLGPLGGRQLPQRPRQRAAETSAANLRLLANTAGQELTYTCVPPGSGDRMGIDRDEDGYFDRDEIDAGSDPANPLAIRAAPSRRWSPPRSC